MAEYYHNCKLNNHLKLTICFGLSIIRINVAFFVDLVDTGHHTVNMYFDSVFISLLSLHKTLEKEIGVG